MESAELEALVDTLCHDKALGKRVDRPCDRLREGMALVGSGELSQAELALALLEVAGEDKVERAVRHVRHERQLSDAPTIPSAAAVQPICAS